MSVNEYLLSKGNKLKINSIDIVKGDVFAAFAGKNTHGNTFISEVIEKGAKYIITDKKPDQLLDTNKIIIVDDLVDFLLTIAKSKRSLFEGKVIGITGSIGKTSVKENLKYFLSSLFKVSASIKSYNNHLGVIISLINMELSSEYAIFEMGTNNFSEIQYLTSLIMPSQNIITNIHPTHLEKLKNTRNIANEKSDIFNSKYNPNVEVLILSKNNIDEKFIFDKAINQNISNIMTFGDDSDSTVIIKKIKNVDDFTSSISILINEKDIDLVIDNIQIHRINNILICLLIFYYNKINLNFFVSLAKNIPLIAGRGLNNKIIFKEKNINFIDESYNANPQSMKMCVDYFNQLKLTNDQDKYLILGEMKELGEKTIYFHIELLKYVMNLKIKNVIICGELFKLSLDKVKIKNEIIVMLDLDLVLNFLEKKLNNNDIIFIKGSNSSLTNKLSQIFLNNEV